MTLAPQMAAADTVWLRNGDRLTGTIVFKSGEKLILKSDYAGEITIHWKKVATLVTDKPMVIRRERFGELETLPLQAADAGMVRLGDGEVVPLTAIDQLHYPRKRAAGWSSEGTFDLSLDMDRDDSHSDELDLKLDTRFENGRWRHLVEAEAEQDEKDGERTEEDWNTSYKLDYFIGDRFFLRGEGAYAEDQIDLPEKLYSYGGGFGYSFWNDDIRRFDLISTIDRYHFDFGFDTLELNVWTISWDYRQYFFGKRFDLYSKGDLGAPLIPEVDYLASSEAGIRFHFSHWMHITLHYEVDLVQAEGQRNHDEHYELRVGVDW